MIQKVKKWILVLPIAAIISTSFYAQTNLQVKDLFASVAVTQIDSLTESSVVRITFLLNRPDQTARIDFKIGRDVDTEEVYSGTANIELRGNKYYSVFNGRADALMGDKVIIYWTGDKSKYSDAKYVTVRAQANDGTISERVFCFVRNF